MWRYMCSEVRPECRIVCVPMSSAMVVIGSVDRMYIEFWGPAGYGLDDFLICAQHKRIGYYNQGINRVDIDLVALIVTSFPIHIHTIALFVLGLLLREWTHLVEG